MITNRHSMRRAAIAGIAGLLLVASCSSDAGTTKPVATGAPASAAPTDAPTTDSASTDAPTTDAPTTDAPTTEPAVPAKSPVVIAAIIDATGPSSGPPQGAEIIQAWGTFINAKGGINGHPVTIEVADNGGDAAKSQTILDEMVAKKPVMILLESASTESSIAEGLGKSGIPILGVGYNPAVWGGDIEAFQLHCSTDPGAPVPCALPNAFTLTTTFGAVVDEQVLAAQSVGAKTLVTAACAEVDSCSQAAPVFSTTAAALGLTDLGVVKVSSSAPDYNAECIQWVQQGVDFIQLSLGGAAGAKIFSDCTDQGYTGTFGASAGSVRGELITTEGIKLAGGLNAFPWWVDDAPVVEYRDALNAAGLKDDAINDPTATGIWGALQLFAKANANLGDDPTAAEALDNMYTVKDETLDGLIAPVTFTKGELATHRPCFWPFVLEDGKFTNPLGGLKYQCYPAQ